MQKPKISVIMPVYNTEDYIEEALISILNQTIIDDLEVIMIDDESTDKSRYIIEKYAIDYENFHVFHKENEGQGIARNYGMELANGEYIIFADSDDYLPSDAYESLYDIALRNDSDIVTGNVLRFALYNVWQDNLFVQSFKGLSDIVESTTLNETPSLLWDTVSWNKLFKTDFLKKNNIKFPNKKIIFEDIPFTLKAYILAETISISPELCYYWRLRSNQTSATQQDKNIMNFRNRIEVTEMSLDIMDEHGVDESIRNSLFAKWIAHDLKFNLKRLEVFPKEFHEELFDKIYNIVKVIPDDVIDTQKSYNKALFKMIKNRDFDDVLKFAPLDDELCENPEIPSFVYDKYASCFEFNEDVKNESLSVELKAVNYDETNLYIDFDETLNYLTRDLNVNIGALLVDGDDEYPLYFNSNEKKQVIVPLDLLMGKNHLKIKFVYTFDEFKKEAFMSNNHRKSFNFDGFDIDLDLGIDSCLYIDIRHKKNNEIKISDISFDSNNFILTGKSLNKVTELYMENVITFDKVSYPAEYVYPNEFKLYIPHEDILNAAIKKWELNCEDSLNIIYVSKDFEFYTDYYKIRFINSRNKILIENDIYSPTELLASFNSKLNYCKNENSKLNEKIEELNEKNGQLEQRIFEFKSRKVVKFADKIKR